ncbi:MAG: GxxExxY protein [Planctomycetota bacterium]
MVVERKAVSQLLDEHRAQLPNDLKATGYKQGLHVNFGHFPNVQWERIVRTTK